MNDRSRSVDEVLTATRAVRKRIDFERSVPRQLLLECLEIAVQAPTGSNRPGLAARVRLRPAKKQVIARLLRPIVRRLRELQGRWLSSGASDRSRCHHALGELVGAAHCSPFESPLPARQML